MRDAFFGVRRFGDFVAHLEIPRAVLSDRLRGLVDNGVLVRTSDPRRSGRQLYELTGAGRELWPALHALITWGSAQRTPSARRYLHAACGAELDARAGCQSCAVVPGPEDVIMTRRSNSPGTRGDVVSLALREPHRLLEPLDTGADAPGQRIAGRSGARVHHGKRSRHARTDDTRNDTGQGA